MRFRIALGAVSALALFGAALSAGWSARRRPTEWGRSSGPISGLHRPPKLSASRNRLAEIHSWIVDTASLTRGPHCR